jgi:hypothetical protein
MRTLARITRSQLSTWGLTLTALAGPASAADKYALVAAMGDRFMASHEVHQTGSRLPNFDKRALEVKDDGINKLAVASLNEAVKKMHPQSERILLSVPLSQDTMDRVRAIEENAFATAVEALRARPDRSQWHRIVLVTPANRVDKKDGLGPDTQGMGLFTQGLCQSDIRDCDKRRSMASGVQVTNPDGETIRSDRFVAPYFFAKIWILDPQSLQVLDSEVVMDHMKYNDANSDAMDQNQVFTPKFLAARLVERVEASTTQAVGRTELRGKVEVNEKGEVRPAPPR